MELAGGDKAHFIDTGGDGSCVLLLHGILVSSWAWRFNLEPLSRRFRVVALCQKGHGWSDKADSSYTLDDLTDFTRRFLRHLGIRRTHIIGNSLGGAVALRLAMEEPALVDRLVLVDPAAVPLRVIHYFLGIQSSKLAPLYQLAGRPWVFQLILRGLAYRNIPIDRHYMDWFMAPLKQQGAMRAAARISRNLQSGLETVYDGLDRVTQPTLLVWGRHDKLVPLRAGRILVNKLPDARLEVFDHCAHCAMEEDPPRFNRLVVDFLTVQG